eukprot:RCo030281
MLHRDCHVEGVLNVKSGILWHKRYVQLSGSELTVFRLKDEKSKFKSPLQPTTPLSADDISLPIKDEKSAEVFDVTLVQIKEAGDDRGFSLVGPKLKRHLSLKTQTKEEYSKWIETFKRFQGSISAREKTASGGLLETCSSVVLPPTPSGRQSPNSPPPSAGGLPTAPKPGMWPCNRCGAWNDRLAGICTNCKGEGVLRSAKSTGNLAANGTRHRLAAHTSKGIPLTPTTLPPDPRMTEFAEGLRGCGCSPFLGSAGSTTSSSSGSSATTTSSSSSASSASSAGSQATSSPSGMSPDNSLIEGSVGRMGSPADPEPFLRSASARVDPSSDPRGGGGAPPPAGQDGFCRVLASPA